MKKSVQILAVFMFLQAFAFANSAQQQYIEKYRELAVEEMQRTGIPASIKLAQGILESNSGRSKLAQRANNHFGIKCGGDWVGSRFFKEDDDYDKRGRLIKSCFRKYNRAKDSWYAHSEFLKKPRYQYLYNLRADDYKGWARGLKRAGYATSPSYAHDLITVIETYRLYEYDVVESQLPNKILEEPVLPRKEIVIPTNESPQELKMIDYVNDVKVTYVQEGETLMDIAGRTGVSSNSLLKYNELFNSSSVVMKTGTRVFLQLKRNANRDKQVWHKVQPGENMFDISQKYGIQLEKQYERNLMKEGTQPAVGEQIMLRGKRHETPDLRGATAKETVESTAPAAKVSIPTPEQEAPKPRPELQAEEVEEEGGFMNEEDVVYLDELDNPFEEEIMEEEVIVRTHESETLLDSGFGEEEELVVLQTPEVIEMPQTNIASAPEKAYYTVRPKDTLYSIARLHGATVNQIMSWNSLSNNTIHPNQQLRVK
ncbi:MAG: glucosaminidase domain-containing protein [Bacteroidota bacterium]